MTFRMTGAARLALALLIAGGAGLVALGAGVAPLEATPVHVGASALGLRIDVLSAVLLCFVGCIGWVVSSYAGRNLRGQSGTGRFGALLMGTLGALAVMVSAASLPVFALGWTVSGLGMAALVAHAGTPRAIRAAGYVRRRLLLGDLLMWTAVLLGLVVLPSLDRAEVGDIAGGRGTDVVVLLLVGACVIRSALFPVWRWLPETAEAPSPVSALLHAGLVNGTGILAALFWPLFRASRVSLLVLMGVGAASVVFGTLAGRLRADVKGRLACSTIAQMGYMTLQVGLGLPAAAVLHLIGHGFYKAWLFLRAGGAVTRSRWRGTPLRTSRRAVTTGTVAAVGCIVGASMLAAPSLVRSVGGLGPVAVIPAVFAIITAVVATVLASLSRLASRTGIALVAAGGALLAGAYATGLAAWERLLATTLPLAPVWSSEVAVALVAATIVGGAVLGITAVALPRRASGPFAVRLAATALPPWARARTRDAGWPTVPAPRPVITPELATDAVTTAARLIGPAWPLREIVASNPLALLENFDVTDAAHVASRVLGVRGYLGESDFITMFDAGRITRADLREALVEQFVDRGIPAPGANLDAMVESLVRTARCAASREPAPADAKRRPDSSETSDEHAAWWCQRAWSGTASNGSGPWVRLRQTCVHSAYDGALGLRGASRLIEGLPEDPAEALALLCSRAGIDETMIVEYLTRLLSGLPGWTAHAQWRARVFADPTPVLELAVVRVVLELLLVGDATNTLRARADDEPVDPAELSRCETWQRALEAGFRRPLLDDLRAGGETLASACRSLEEKRPVPLAQAVFCIDVRSERLRRALEAQGPFATYGFAGFFGAALRHVTGDGAEFDQCPALLEPSFAVVAQPRPDGLRPPVRGAALGIGAAPLTPLLVAEATGWLAGVAAVVQTAAPRLWHRLSKRWTLPDRWGIPADTTRSDGHGRVHTGLPVGMTHGQRVALAAGALRTIGLVEDFAPLLVICGHAATVENNAFATAYDCGACGGNGGHVNARVLAEVLNDPTVRETLAADGIRLPDSTVAVAAAHDTTTDEVELDPAFAPFPAYSERVATLREALGAAGRAVRAERAGSLPGAPRPGSAPAALTRHVRARALDWAEPAPEWGLAGNAAFVIGPRSLTRGLDLDGRVFLHSYDPALDPDGSILASILTAPAVVTQWINAQYYASTVDPGVLGAGDKSTHNVVGEVGVLTGAHGDLRLGLPWQALFDGAPGHPTSERRHEPLRELIVVWATPRRVGEIVGSHDLLARLVANGWVAVAAIDPFDASAWRLTRRLDWRLWEEHSPTRRALVPLAREDL